MASRRALGPTILAFEGEDAACPADALERIARIAEAAGVPVEWWGPLVAREVDAAEGWLGGLTR